MVVVAAIDRSEGASRVVAEADRIADRFDVPLHVVFVIDDSEHTRLIEDYAEKREPMSESVIGQIAGDVTADAVPDGVEDYEAIGLVGDPSDRIVEYATDVDAEDIVIGGRSRSPVGKALFGSVVQSVLLEANRPVVSVISDRD